MKFKVGDVVVYINKKGQHEYLKKQIVEEIDIPNQGVWGDVFMSFENIELDEIYMNEQKMRKLLGLE